MGDDYEKPSRRERRQKRSWKRPRKNRLTRSARWPETACSLKNLGSTPANSLQSRLFYAPHSVSRAPARLTRSLGVSRVSARTRTRLSALRAPPPFFGWFSIQRKLRRPSWLLAPPKAHATPRSKYPREKSSKRYLKKAMVLMSNKSMSIFWSRRLRQSSIWR